jgi:two-component system NtrC family sensor kinase
VIPGSPELSKRPSHRQWAIVASVVIGAALLAEVFWRFRDWHLLVAAALAIGVLGALYAVVVRSREQVRKAQARSDQLALQLDRRISELFSLQELSYVLSESLQPERIVDQVTRYAARFLQADGALVALVEAEGRGLRVAAASGTLEALRGYLSDHPDTSLVRLAIDRDHIEDAHDGDSASVNLLADFKVHSAAVAPLKAQGMTMGALAVADRRGGPFTDEDRRLLSTVATNASVVLANSRLYELVRRGQEEWETAFNALVEGIALVGPDGAIQRANRALAAIVDVPAPELVGRIFTELLPGASDAVSDLIKGAYRPDRAPIVVRLDHINLVLRLNAAPLAGDEPGSVVILIEDVTEQRRLESQIIQNDKMASIGQLVSGVAHELNNPLTSIAGLTELLLERPAHPELPREHLRVIHDQAERASRIVRNLLTFARKGVPEQTAVDLNDVVSRTSLLIVYELELHGIELISNLDPEPVIVLGDRYELQQVLLNLVTNAVQAVASLEPGKARRITLTTTRSGTEAILRVRDTGCGVPKHFTPYLFTPFFTTKAPGEGTGLGLSLSYGLVNAHGGALTYEPPAEGGAEFRVTLPLFAGESLRPIDTEATSANSVDAQRRILVVDEDPAVHRLVTALFAPDGYTVETVRSGEQGLRLAREGGYDLIIADLRVAAGTSSEPFARALLNACPEIRNRLVVACSREEELPPWEHRLHRVSKPFNLRDLRSVAEAILQ